MLKTNLLYINKYIVKYLRLLNTKQPDTKV